MPSIHPHRYWNQSLIAEVFKDRTDTLSFCRVLDLYQSALEPACLIARVLLARIAGPDRSWDITRSATRVLTHRLIEQTIDLGNSVCTLSYNEAGAPCFLIDDKPSGWNLGIAHSADWLMVGVASGAHIGVDLEFGRPRKRRAAMAALLGWQVGITDDDDFHSKWTVWEAGVKCVSGSVLTRASDEFEKLCEAPPGSAATAGAWSVFRDRIGKLFFAVVMNGNRLGSIVHRDLDPRMLEHG